MRAAFVSYYHPQDRMAAAARLQRTITSFEKAGWRVTVISPPPSDAGEPGRHGRIRRIFKRVSIAFALTLRSLQCHGDVYFISSPPFSMMIPALALKLIKSRTALVFEERDLLSLNPLLTFKAVRASFWMRALEHWLLKRVDVMVVASEGAKNELEDYWNDLRKRSHPVAVISNGYFREDYKFLQGAPALHRQGPLQIVHTGNFYGSRHPQPLLDALIEIRKRRPEIDLHRTLRFIFIGVFQSTEDQVRFIESAKIAGLENLFELRALVPRQEALRAVHQADIALLITHHKGSEWAVPAKLYEYIALGRPILALTSDRSVTQPIAQHQLGWSVAHDNISELSERLLWIIENADEVRNLRLPGTALTEFDAEAQVEKLQDLVRAVLRR